MNTFKDMYIYIVKRKENTFLPMEMCIKFGSVRFIYANVTQL